VKKCIKTLKLLEKKLRQMVWIQSQARIPVAIQNLLLMNHGYRPEPHSLWNSTRV
jgi:hypothetical protein